MITDYVQTCSLEKIQASPKENMIVVGECLRKVEEVLLRGRGFVIKSERFWEMVDRED